MRGYSYATSKTMIFCAYISGTGFPAPLKSTQVSLCVFLCLFLRKEIFKLTEDKPHKKARVKYLQLNYICNNPRNSLF